MVGIISYGVYIPRFRIKVGEIARVWGANADDITGGLGVKSKSVPDLDEDTATIAVEAARSALARRHIDPASIGAVYVGSESHPYAVKPTACTVGEAIGATPCMTAADFEFACKAGTAGIQTCMGMAKSGMITYGIAIGSDVAQGAPSDALEYTAAAGGAAYVIGNDDPIAVIHHTCSYTTDTPDFWRREGQDYPRHGGRFTGEPAYFKHVLSATRGILAKTGYKPSDFRYAVFHMPNGKFPLQAGKELGFKKEQLDTGWIVNTMGNTYSGSSPTGLAAVLDVAAPGDLILITSFGSGAGSDSFVLKATGLLPERQGRAATVRSMLDGSRRYLTYGEYAKFREKIILND
jgi:hydroxymethylglutaryl-CoA synthase